MIVVMFVNQNDSQISILGRSLLSLLDRTYYVFTRDPDSVYPYCPVEKTMDKLREICNHISDERVILCFGCRVIPDNIKKVEYIAQKKSGNVVLLKKLKGSKTWTLNPLRFSNERIADCGIFILQRKDILESRESNFNTFLHHLIKSNKLIYEMVDFWVFSSPRVHRGRR